MTGEHRSKLTIVVEVPDHDPQDVGPRVRFLIDGVESLGEVFDEGIGVDPDDVIGPFSPLRPEGVPHDVALMRCACGSSECNFLVASVRRDSRDVVWDDFRMGASLDVEMLSSVDVSPIRFDAAQYAAELDRAHADRGWESAVRMTGRLVREGIVAAQKRLTRMGYAFDTIWHAEGSLAVSLYEMGDAGRRQTVLGFDIDGRDPPGRAAGILKAVLESRPADWSVAFRGDWVAA